MVVALVWLVMDLVSAMSEWIIIVVVNEVLEALEGSMEKTSVAPEELSKAGVDVDWTTAVLENMNTSVESEKLSRAGVDIDDWTTLILEKMDYPKGNRGNR